MTRIADPLAPVLALAVFAGMAGPGIALPVLVLAAAQAALHLAVARSRPAPTWRRFVVLWSVQAGVTWAVAGEATAASAAVFVAVGFVFASLALVVPRYVGRAADSAGYDAEPRTDTAPLPVAGECGFVQDGDGDRGRGSPP